MGHNMIFRDTRNFVFTLDPDLTLLHNLSNISNPDPKKGQVQSEGKITTLESV